MTEQMNPPPQPDGTGDKPTVLWLFVAFFPSLAAIPFLAVRNPAQWAVVPLLFLAMACCMCAGFGLLTRMKDVLLRIVLGLILAGVFFFLNVLVVLFIGCSGMGRMAP